MATEVAVEQGVAGAAELGLAVEMAARPLGEDPHPACKKPPAHASAIVRPWTLRPAFADVRGRPISRVPFTCRRKNGPCSSFSRPAGRPANIGAPQVPRPQPSAHRTLEASPTTTPAAIGFGIRAPTLRPRSVHRHDGWGQAFDSQADTPCHALRRPTSARWTRPVKHHVVPGSSTLSPKSDCTLASTRGSEHFGARPACWPVPAQSRSQSAPRA